MEIFPTKQEHWLQGHIQAGFHGLPEDGQK